MIKILLGLFVVGAGATGFAADSGANEINCDYIAATSVNTFESINGSNVKKAAPTNNPGQLKLVKEGKTYKGSVSVSDSYQLRAEAAFTSPTELSVTLKVFQISNQYTTNLASAGGFFAPDNSGNFSGKVLVRSSDLENLAVQNEVDVNVAPLDQLPIGSNFIGAMITCK